MDCAPGARLCTGHTHPVCVHPLSSQPGHEPGMYLSTLGVVCLSRIVSVSQHAAPNPEVLSMIVRSHSCNEAAHGTASLALQARTLTPARIKCSLFLVCTPDIVGHVAAVVASPPVATLVVSPCDPGSSFPALLTWCQPRFHLTCFKPSGTNSGGARHGVWPRRGGSPS